MNNLKELHIHTELRECNICGKEKECVCVIIDYETDENILKSTLSWICINCLGGAE